MKFISLLLLLAAPLHAELLATFHTDRGNVVVSLYFDKTPQTVANFITLAQGTRSRIDPTTGAVIRKPLYAGEKFFRVVNDPFFKIAQTGSGTGTNNGGPGYTIRDEISPSIIHDPHVLAMGNSGYAHSNGSQIYLTGDVAMPQLDNRYTVFGKVDDPPSRVVINAIINGGSNGTTINSVSFQRTSPAAVAFSEHAQNLPVCSGVPGKLEVDPGVECIYDTADFQPAGSVLQVFRSLNMQTWSKLGEIYQGTGMIGEVDRYILDNAQASRAFYNISLAAYPDALAPASMAERRIEFGTATTRKFIITYDATGFFGTFEDSNTPGVNVGIVSSSYDSSPYDAEWVFYLSDGRRFAYSCTLDTENTTKISGRNKSYQWNGSAFVSLSSGTLELSKP